MNLKLEVGSGGQWKTALFCRLCYTRLKLFVG